MAETGWQLHGHSYKVGLGVRRLMSPLTGEETYDHALTSYAVTHANFRSPGQTSYHRRYMLVTEGRLLTYCRPTAPLHGHFESAIDDLDLCLTNVDFHFFTKKINIIVGDGGVFTLDLSSLDKHRFISIAQALHQHRLFSYFGRGPQSNYRLTHDQKNKIKGAKDSIRVAIDKLSRLSGGPVIEGEEEKKLVGEAPAALASALNFLKDVSPESEDTDATDFCATVASTPSGPLIDRL